MQGHWNESADTAVRADDGRIRCAWVSDEQLRRYHDDEWGRAPQTDAGWFELIVLETFQAGLSWRTVLHKRDAFRQAFDGFSVACVADYGAPEVEQLLDNPGIVRSRAKVTATIENAKVARSLIHEYGSLRAFVEQIPSAQLLETLQRTFRRVGRTTAISIAEAAGLVPPAHDPDCWLAPTPGPGGRAVQNS